MIQAEGWPPALVADFAPLATYEDVSSFLDRDRSHLPQARLETDFRARTITVSFPPGSPLGSEEAWLEALTRAPVLGPVTRATSDSRTTFGYVLHNLETREDFSAGTEAEALSHTSLFSEGQDWALWRVHRDGSGDPEMIAAGTGPVRQA